MMIFDDLSEKAKIVKICCAEYNSLQTCSWSLYIQFKCIKFKLPFKFNIKSYQLWRSDFIPKVTLTELFECLIQRSYFEIPQWWKSSWYQLMIITL